MAHCVAISLVILAFVLCREWRSRASRVAFRPPLTSGSALIAVPNALCIYRCRLPARCRLYGVYGGLLPLLITSTSGRVRAWHGRDAGLPATWRGHRQWGRPPNSVIPRRTSLVFVPAEPPAVRGGTEYEKPLEQKCRRSLITVRLERHASQGGQSAEGRDGVQRGRQAEAGTGGRQPLGWGLGLAWGWRKPLDSVSGRDGRRGGRQTDGQTHGRPGSERRTLRDPDGVRG